MFPISNLYLPLSDSRCVCSEDGFKNDTFGTIFTDARYIDEALCNIQLSKRLFKRSIFLQIYLKQRIRVV